MPPAPKGNQFWKARSKHGRDKIFKTPDILWEAACEYFQWVDDNPLYEHKTQLSQGEWVETAVPKMRAMTIEGLCIFLDVNTQYFTDFENGLDISKREDKDFSVVIKKVREIIANQKFTGAAADLLNANIIARDLGLRDKGEIDHKSSDGTMSPKEVGKDVVDALVKKLVD